MKKIVLGFIVSILILCSYSVWGASYNFNFTGPSEATNGQTVTLSVTGTGLTGKVLLSATNATLSNSQVWVEKNTVNVTAKITGFPATITASPSELTDNDYNIVSIGAKTITIKEKQTQVVPPPSGGGSSGGSGSTGGGSSSGGTSSGGSSSSGSNKPSTSKPTTKPSTGSSSQQSPDKPSVPNESNLQNNGDVKSGNNYLQSITVNVGNLTPEFYRETFEYTVENIPEEVMDMEVSAVAEDERASISGLRTCNFRRR